MLLSLPTHQHVFETAIRDMLANLLNISRDEVYLLPQQPGNVIVQVLMPSEIKQQASRIHALFLNSGIEVVSIVEDFNGASLRNIMLKKAILYQENF